jgi:plasmid maintenance system antidote protein VapI
VTLADEVADEVRTRAAARNLSQTALARAAGIPPTLLHRALKHERHLTIDELGAVASALDVTPEHLLRLARQSVLAMSTPRSGESSESNSEPRQV